MVVMEFVKTVPPNYLFSWLIQCAITPPSGRQRTLKSPSHEAWPIRSMQGVWIQELFHHHYQPFYYARSCREKNLQFQMTPSWVETFSPKPCQRWCPRQQDRLMSQERRTAAPLSMSHLASNNALPGHDTLCSHVTRHSKWWVLQIQASAQPKNSPGFVGKWTKP